MEENLKLENQLCFPFYSLSKAIINHYRIFLDELDITYPQYLVFMVLWEKEPLSVNEIGQKLALDSGTLTPMLKRLEQKEFILRNRRKSDERIVEISLTSKGKELQHKVKGISEKLIESLGITDEILTELKQITPTIQKILNNIQK